MRRSTFPRGTCPRCGQRDHVAKDRRFQETECHFLVKEGTHRIRLHAYKRRRSNERWSTSRQNLASDQSRQQWRPHLSATEAEQQAFCLRSGHGIIRQLLLQRHLDYTGKTQTTTCTQSLYCSQRQATVCSGKFHVKASLDSPKRTRHIEFNVAQSRLNLL